MRLILHSDDLGLVEEIDKGILVCAREGVLTSTSVLANGITTLAALAEAKTIPSLGVGVHLNIVRGSPLSHPSEVSSLVDEKGNFFNSVLELLWYSMVGRLSSDEIYTEYKRQLELVLAQGIVPTHLDSEKHSHVLIPEATLAISKLAMEFGIKKVRRINEVRFVGLFSEVVERPRLLQYLKVLLLERKMRVAYPLLKQLISSDFTYGIGVSGIVGGEASLRMLETVLNSPRQESVEWIFHVGNGDTSRSVPSSFGKFYLTQARARESAFLLSAQVRELLHQHKTQLISYRELL